MMRVKQLLRSLNLIGHGRRLDTIEHDLQSIAGASARRLDAAEDAVRVLQGELEALRDRRAPALEERLDLAEGQLATASKRLAGLELRHDHAEESLRVTAAEAGRLRDRVVPAAVRRTDALIERLSAEIDEVASLVERILRGEPLPVPAASAAGGRELAAALDQVQPALVEAFRGSEEEISHRLQHHLPSLAGAAPVLDLGCGRGELLLLLREQGIAATGVEADPALVQAARRRGLEVIEGDVLEVLRGSDDCSWGAVSALHLLEHLPFERLVALLAEARRALRPGGTLLVETPNPRSLRVAASLHWLDPTHQHPLHPETLSLLVTAAGLELVAVEELHPFPDDQLLAAIPELAGAAPAGGVELELRALVCRLDELIHGRRDYALRALKPDGDGSNH